MSNGNSSEGTPESVKRLRAVDIMFMCGEKNGVDTDFLFVSASDHDRIVAERNAEQKLLVTKVIDLSRYVDELRAEMERQREAHEDTLENHVGMQIILAAQEATIAELQAEVEKLRHDCGNHNISQADIDWCVLCDRESNAKIIATQARELEQQAKLSKWQFDEMRAVYLEDIARLEKEAEVLKAVIEKLREQRNECLEYVSFDRSLMDAELAAITKLEKKGAKDE